MRQGVTAEVRFRLWAAERGGVFARREAMELGMTDHRFRRGVSTGEWVSFRGVWIMSACPKGTIARARAAWLRAGRRALVTGPTALELIHALPTSSPSVFVSVPSGDRRRVEGAVFLRDRVAARAGARVSGVPLVHPERALIDSLRVLDPSAARDVLHEALRRRWVVASTLVRWHQRLRGHRGNRQLGQLAEYAATGSHAESERVLARRLRSSRVRGWTQNEPIYGAGGLIGIGDFVFRELRIVVEVDGAAWHVTRDRFERDRRRQNQLVTNGWLVLRFTWDRLVGDPVGVVAEIESAIRLRKAR